MAKPPAASELREAQSVKLREDDVYNLQRQKRAQRVNNEMYFRIHPELRQMVSSFVSALLQDKPDDVHLYAEQFFTNPELAHSLGLVGWSRPDSPSQTAPPLEEDEFEADELSPEIEGSTGMDAVDLESMLIGLFQEADADGSGALDAEEFAQVMETASLGLSKREVQSLLAEIDENSDNSISYSEFVPLAVEVIQTMRLKQRYDMHAADVGEELRYAAALVVNMEPEAFASAVLKAEEKLGKGEGVLSKAQVKALLKQPAFGLSKAQAAAAAAAVAYDEHGNVPVDTLAATLYEIVITAVADALAQQNLGEVGAQIADTLAIYDKGDTGFLDKKVVRTALMQGFPFMTTVQVTSLLAAEDAPINAEGKLAWKAYLPKLEACIKAFGDPEAIRERAELAVRAEFQPSELMSVKDREKFDTMLAELFREADADGNGMLDKEEFRQMLKKTDLGLTSIEAEELFMMFDHDSNKMVSLNEFTDLAYTVLANLARERKIQDVMTMSE